MSKEVKLNECQEREGRRSQSDTLTPESPAHLCVKNTADMDDLETHSEAG